MKNHRITKENKSNVCITNRSKVETPCNFDKIIKQVRETLDENTKIKTDAL